MPTAEQILEDLHAIANDWKLLAVVWHVYFGVLAAILILGIHPTRRTVETSKTKELVQ